MTLLLECCLQASHFQCGAWRRGRSSRGRGHRAFGVSAAKFEQAGLGPHRDCKMWQCDALSALPIRLFRLPHRPFGLASFAKALPSPPAVSAERRSNRLFLLGFYHLRVAYFASWSCWGYCSDDVLDFGTYLPRSWVEESHMGLSPPLRLSRNYR